MPDLLIICPHNQTLFDLEKIGVEAGFRVKGAVALPQAIEWLEMKEFDLVFSHIGYPYDLQQRAAELLWKKNQFAPYIAFDLSNDSPEVDRGEFRLLGAEVIEGPDAQNQMRDALQKIRSLKKLSNDGFKILVVEDLDSPRDIICAFIERLGFPNVVGAASAKEALAELQVDPAKYSCIITDVNMPQVNGKQLIETIRGSAKLSHIPVIVLTAYGTADCLVDCLKAGASGFLVKPPSKRDLEREIARSLRIAARSTSPRLANVNEAELIRAILIEKGLC